MSDVIDDCQHKPGDGPRFTHRALPRDPRAVVLLLHGGAVQSNRPVDARSLSWQRARFLYDGLQGRLLAEGIGIALLRFTVKGWNAKGAPVPPPVTDARWALDRLATDVGAPIVLLGHSMGARTGAAVADHPSVRGLVALAPWFPTDEPVAPLRNKTLRAAHGRTDRITSAAATRAYVARADEIADASFTDLGRTGHYLLRRVPDWHAFALEACRAIADS